MTSFFPLPQNKRGGRAKSLLDTRDQAAFISNDSPGRVAPPMKLSAALVLKEVSDRRKKEPAVMKKTVHRASRVGGWVGVGLLTSAGSHAVLDLIFCCERQHKRERVR